MRRAKLLSNFLILSLLFTMSGCSSDKTEFPWLPPKDITAQSSTLSDETIANTYNEYPEITVALPYGSDTVDYLSKLYYAKNNNLMGDDSGETISLDYLASLDVPWVVNSIQIPEEGVDDDVLSVWNSQDAMPNVYMTGDIDSAIDAGFAVPMDDYLFDNTLLSSQEISMRAMMACNRNNAVYGVPHYASIMILVGNLDYVPEDGQLTFRNDMDDFNEYLNDMYLEFSDDEETFVPFYCGSDVEDFEELIELINSDIDAQQITDDLTESALISDYSIYGGDAVLARNTGLWLASSADVSQLNSYYPNKLYYVSLPYDDTDNPPTPIGNIYSLCLAPGENSGDSDFAADFAAFISLDTDAQLLIRRLNNLTGYLPITDNSLVWDVANREEIFGSTAMLLEQQMDNCLYE